ncbi:MAG: hypothetical protein ACOYI5_04685 [Christensenellales bacterium]|jgi:uncharacterized membrane protein
MAKKKSRAVQPGARERIAQLSLYYKVVTVYIIIVAIAYGALRAANAAGYMLINTTAEYWLWYALVIGVILLVGKFIANIPKNPNTQRGVRISVGIVSVVTIFAMYAFMVSRIDNGFSRYAAITSQDGAREVIIMRADVDVAATQTEDAKVYTLYTAHLRLNRFFCETRKGSEVIMLIDDPDATLDYEWTENGVTLKTAGNAIENLDTLTLTFN